MNLPDNCREIFLDGVTDIYLHPVKGSALPVPFCVSHILELKNYKFGDPVLHVATSGEDYIMADSITAKFTMEKNGNGNIYSFDISANITNGYNNVCEANKSIQGNEFYVVLKKADGTDVLCYTLPGTFTFNSPASKTITGIQRTVQIGLKSLSEFIPLK